MSRSEKQGPRPQGVLQKEREKIKVGRVLCIIRRNPLIGT